MIALRLEVKHIKKSEFGRPTEKKELSRLVRKLSQVLGMTKQNVLVVLRGESWKHIQLPKSEEDLSYILNHFDSPAVKVAQHVNLHPDSVTGLREYFAHRALIDAQPQPN